MPRKWLLCMTLSVALVAAACGGDDNSDDGGTESDDTDATTEVPAGDVDTDAVFRWGHSGATLTMDPTQSASGSVINFFTPVFDTLTVLSPEGTVEPGIAESWEFSDDGLTLTLTIAEGRTFQDGTPLDAAAVVANLERARGEETSTARFLAPIESLDAPDATTVVITTSAPAAQLIAALGDYAGMMMSPAGFDSPDVATKPIGSGPFTVTENTETRVTYARWDDYHAADGTELAGIEMEVISDDAARLNALRSGQIDATFIRTNQVGEAEAAGLQLEQVDRVQTYGIQLNPARSELGSPEVRQAIMHAIDRAAIDEAIYDGGCAAAVQYYPESFFAFDGDLDEEALGGYDPDRARELLAEAGVPDGFSVEIISPSIPTYSTLGEIVQAQLGEIGIEATLQAVEPAQYTAAVREGDFEIGVQAFDPARPDPASFFASYFLPGGPGNPGGFEVDGLDQDYLTIEAAQDDERTAAIQDFQQKVLEAGPPVVSVCTPVLSVAYREGVGNLQAPVLGNYVFNDVSIAQG